jgi:hypothetical protein
MTNGWHVTARHIVEWTNVHNRKAQDTFPLLVRKLLLASTNPSFSSFPAGDSVTSIGWDGVHNAEKGNAFCPEGVSVWEFGTGKRIDEKANEDYQKRTQNPLGVDKKKSTFIFVTPQIWSKRKNWVKAKTSENEWASVRGLNADDLEAWLEQCPAVHRWFARLIGLRPEGAWDIEQAWTAWSTATKPPSNSDLVLGDREDQAKVLVSRLRVGPSVICILGESEDEAHAFALAVLKERLEFSSCLLVVKEPKEWDILSDSQQPLILIPQFDKLPSFGLAIQQGHRVILATSSSQIGGRQADIILSKASPDTRIKALVTMGVDRDTAENIVRSCRGSLNPIRRHPALAPVDFRLPDWANAGNAEPLVAALLGGAWIADNKSDCEALAKLSGLPCSEFEQLLNRWAITDDRPVQRVGNVWRIVSRADAWLLLNRFINASVLKSFGEVAKGVLQEVNPRFELPPEERWLASVHGKVTRYSDVLRHGIAEMLAMLASYGDKDCQNIGTESAQDQVSLAVRQLLTENMSGQRWGSLSKELPLLAEAAPEIFMDAVENGLQGENPPVMDLFAEETYAWGLTHADLLWALEGLSWNTEYLARITRILAKLARLDPGGRYHNRPSNTLKEIFQGWLPQAKASLNERLQIIDSLMRDEPASGWKLLLNLLPERGGGISTPIYRPLFRSWDEGWKKGVTREEYRRHTLAVAERLLKYVAEEPNTRWLDVVRALPQLPKEPFDKAISLLGSSSGALTGTATYEIRNELRRIISNHRRFPDSRWALPKESVDRLDDVYQSLIPQDLITKHKFLFDDFHPDLPYTAPGQTYEQRQNAVEQARTKALKEIWDAFQAGGIIRLAVSVKLPWSLGNSLASSSFADGIEELVLSWLENENTSLVQTAQAYVNASCRQKPEWLAFVRKHYADTWSDGTWAAFSLGLPFGKGVFDFLKASTESVRRKYWENIRGYYLQREDIELANWAIEQLLTYRRPFAAINAAAQYLNTVAEKEDLNADVLARALELAATDPADWETSQSVTMSHDIIEVLEAVQSALMDERRLARIEWVYMRLLHDEEFKPRVLLKEIVENPSFFVHLICLVYKGHPPIDGEFSDLSPEMRKAQVQNAYILLESADQLPGQNGSEIDAAQLRKWIDEARQECTQRNRKAIGDECIGKLLSHAPPGSDEIWPHQVIRDIVEQLESRDIESGIEIGLLNQRGVTLRSLGSGGEQERKLADTFKQQADKIKYKWPRTAAMLSRIAESYRRDALWMDRHDQLDGEME